MDLQNTLIAAAATPAVAGAEPAQRLDAQATQAAFALELDRRDEEVAATSELVGNRVDAKDGSRERPGGRRRRTAHKPETAFAAMIEEAAGETEEPAHIVDFTA